MKKVVIFLAMLAGASVSLLAQADASQGSSSGSQQALPQTSNQGGTASTNTAPNTGNMPAPGTVIAPNTADNTGTTANTNNSNGAVGSSNEDDDTSS